MKSKDLSAVDDVDTPSLVLEDPAAKRAAESFGPAALAAEAQRLEEEELVRAGNLKAAPVQEASGAGSHPDQRPQGKRPRGTYPQPAVPGPLLGDLAKKTGYPSEGGRQFLNQFRRRRRFAKTLVAEYALEQLFATVDDDTIVATLRDHRRNREASLRRPLTTWVGGATQQRIERLKDDREIPEGLVIGYAIDWLAANQNEETIAAALRARGYGYYRSPRA